MNMKERIDMIVRNIMSGNNGCGTLANAVRDGNTEYFIRAVTPVVKVYEEEAQFLTSQRTDALNDAEKKRFALETIASNMQIPHGIKSIVEQALGRSI